MKPLTPNQIDLCRKDFGFFAQQGMLRVLQIKLNIKRPDGSDGYLYPLFRSIQKLVFHGAGNQWWNIPPRCAKTTLGFIFHAAFAIGLNPRAKFMYITHQRELMRDKFTDLYQLINSDFYRQIFPNFKLIGRRNLRIIRSKEGGFISGFSISGHVTGTGAGDTSVDFEKGNLYGGCIILDDLHDASSAYSRTQLISNCQVFEQCITSRRNTANTPFLVIGQRISVYDIFGHLEKHSGRQFDKIIMPAILPNGESIDEERLPVAEMKLKEKLDNYTYLAQYQQQPPEPSWRIFKEQSFKIIDFEIDQRRYNPRPLLVFIDLNSGSMKTLDRTAVAIFHGFHRKSEHTYEPMRCGLWIDLFLRKADLLTIEHDIHEFLKPYIKDIHTIVCEEHGIGAKVIANLRNMLPGTCIRPSRRTRNKLNDVFPSCSKFVDAGHVYLRNDNPEFHAHIFEEFEKLHTETEFADDICDVLSEFIMWFPEANKVGLVAPPDLYNKHALLSSGSVSPLRKPCRDVFSYVD